MSCISAKETHLDHTSIALPSSNPTSVEWTQSGTETSTTQAAINVQPGELDIGDTSGQVGDNGALTNIGVNEDGGER